MCVGSGSKARRDKERARSGSGAFEQDEEANRERLWSLGKAAGACKKRRWRFRRASRDSAYTKKNSTTKEHRGAL